MISPQTLCSTLKHTNLSPLNRDSRHAIVDLIIGAVPFMITSAYTKSSRIPELDGLRGVAVLSVVCIHYIVVSPSAHSPIAAFFQRAVALGWSGVDLFFVLSGFLIGGILLDARGSPNYFKAFYARRFFRIIPLYYAWTALYIIVVALAGHTLQSHSNSGRAEMSGAPVYIHFLFLQNIWPIAYWGLGAGWFTQMWSLAVEEQFYLVCPWLIRFVSTRRLRLVLFAVIAGAPFLRLTLRAIAHVRPMSIYILTPCRADALAIGILAALLWRNERWKQHLAHHWRYLNAARIALAAGVFCLLIFAPANLGLAEQTVGYTWLAVFYAVCVLSVLSRPSDILAKCMRLPWLRNLGTVSYCIYIVHGATLIVCHGVLLKHLPQVSTATGVAVTLLAAVITYGCARLSWRFFEQPLLDRGHRFRYNSPREVACPSSDLRAKAAASGASI
jgi:peptidoglycan/LPS O-acetylase OafA/YrhL